MNRVTVSSLKSHKEYSDNGTMSSSETREKGAMGGIGDWKLGQSRAAREG